MMTMNTIQKIMIFLALVAILTPLHNTLALGESSEVLEYQPISVLPGIIDDCSVDPTTGESVGNCDLPTFEEYFSRIFIFVLGIAAILAVVRITIGGIKYMTSSVAGSLEDAKEMIRQAIIGLILLLVSYLILNQINPDLLRIGLRSVTTQGQCQVCLDSGGQCNLKFGVFTCE